MNEYSIHLESISSWFGWLNVSSGNETRQVSRGLTLTKYLLCARHCFNSFTLFLNNVITIAILLPQRSHYCYLYVTGVQSEGREVK